MTSSTGDYISDWVAHSSAGSWCSKSSSTESCFTDLSMLGSSSSSIRFPKPEYQSAFRWHRGNMAINRRAWSPVMANESSKATPIIFPHMSRMIHRRSKSNSSYKSRTKEELLRSIFRKPMVSVVSAYLRTFTWTQHENASHIMTAIDAMRKFNHFDSSKW